MLFLATSGAFAQGQAGAYFVSASLLGAATPLLVLPFSTRIARVVAFVLLAGFALAMLWAAFGSTVTTPSLVLSSCVLSSSFCCCCSVAAWLFASPLASAPNYSFKRTAVTGCGTIMRWPAAAA